jgi:hypothetical protein
MPAEPKLKREWVSGPPTLHFGAAAFAHHGRGERRLVGAEGLEPPTYSV